MCSTVHGSYQLSTDPPKLRPVTSSHPDKSQRHTLMWRPGVAQPDPTLPPGHLVPVGPYAPTPIKPKGKQENKKLNTS